ncbi:MAG: DUF58 domain-containing protein, partial [Phenylobacterium sp.]
MIYPTRRAIALTAAGAAVAIAAGLAGPGLWTAGAVWVLAVGGLMLADALLAPAAGGVGLDIAAPAFLGV